MIKENKVSLWLGTFGDEDAFNQYIEVKYDDDGNMVPSAFQRDFQIKQYDQDAIESDWIADRCNTVKDLLAGFTCDEEIIPVAENLMHGEDISQLNSIVLIYNFEYDGEQPYNSNLKFIGSIDVHL